MQIIKDGVAVDYSEEEATKILSEPAVTAIADIKWVLHRLPPGAAT